MQTTDGRKRSFSGNFRETPGPPNVYNGGPPAARPSPYVPDPDAAEHKEALAGLVESKMTERQRAGLKDMISRQNLALQARIQAAKQRDQDHAARKPPPVPDEAAAGAQTADAEEWRDIYCKQLLERDSSYNKR